MICNKAFCVVWRHFLCKLSQFIGEISHLSLNQNFKWLSGKSGGELHYFKWIFRRGPRSKKRSLLSKWLINGLFSVGGYQERNWEDSLSLVLSERWQEAAIRNSHCSIARITVLCSTFYFYYQHSEIVIVHFENKVPKPIVDNRCNFYLKSS